MSRQPLLLPATNDRREQDAISSLARSKRAMRACSRSTVLKARLSLVIQRRSDSRSAASCCRCRSCRRDRHVVPVLFAARADEPDSGLALLDRLAPSLLLIEFRRELFTRTNAEHLFHEPAGLSTFAAHKALGLDLGFALRRHNDFDDFR